jgi:hypothetical protein
MCWLRQATPYEWYSHRTELSRSANMTRRYLLAGTGDGQPFHGVRKALERQRFVGGVRYGCALFSEFLA